VDTSALNRIKARLKDTSESWIAGIILVLNLVKLAGSALPRLIQKWLLSFSAHILEIIQTGLEYNFHPPIKLHGKIIFSAED
jgi:hypothetical protein